MVKKITTKNAWNSARREGVHQLSKIMKGSQIYQIDSHIIRKDYSGNQEGYFTYESDEGYVKTFYIERADDNI